MNRIERWLHRLFIGPIDVLADLGTFYEGMRGTWPLTASARSISLEGTAGVEVLSTLYSKYGDNNYYRLYFFGSAVEINQRLARYMQAADGYPPSNAAGVRKGLRSAMAETMRGVYILDFAPVSRHPQAHKRYRTELALSWAQEQYWAIFRIRRGTVQLPLEMLRALSRLLADLECRNPGVYGQCNGAIP